jgi:type IV secretory pathway VirJ component
VTAFTGMACAGTAWTGMPCAVMAWTGTAWTGMTRTGMACAVMAYAGMRQGQRMRRGAAWRRAMRLAFWLGLAWLCITPAHALDGGRYGPVRLAQPRVAPTGFLILFSAGPAWDAADQQAADRLAGEGALVAGVDRATYVATLDAATCYNLVGDADSLAKQLQRELRVATYHAPVLAGLGEGGRLAQLALTQAPANTIAGAVSIDPDAEPGLHSPPCPRDPAASDTLLGFWSVGLTPDVPAAGRVWIDSEAHAGRVPELRRFGPGTSEADMLAALVVPKLAQPAPAGDVTDLPLVELPAEQPSDMLAVILSGDGGWRDLDKTIAESLSRSSVNVIGWDSLRYFWNARTPRQVADDLSRVLRVYGARWHTKHVALIGYSFGADILPFAYNRLPDAERAEVSLLSLLGFAKSADFEIRVGGWLGLPPGDAALPVQPEMATIPPAMVQCFYGEEEDDTICPTLDGTGAMVVRTPGSHHFDRDYDALARQILAAWRKRIE